MVSATQMYSMVKRLFCNKCNFFVHTKCNGISDIISARDYRELEKEPDEALWFYKLCTQDMLPFGSIENCYS